MLGSPTTQYQTRNLVEMLEDFRPLFITVQNDATGFASSRAMIYANEPWGYVVLELQGQRAYSVFGNIEDALAHLREIATTYVDDYAVDFDGSITTQITRKIHSLDI